MSATPHPPSAHLAPIQPGRTNDQLRDLMIAGFAATVDAADAWDLTMIVGRDRLRDAALRLRDDPELRFDQLLDITGIDYLAYPGHRAERFAVVYIFKSTVFRHRIKLKVRLEEDDPALPSLHDLYRIADWAERETWDQYGIVFQGHPNLRRLLNHHEFIGHPLRKDYPVQKRQKLSVNDPMIDQLDARLIDKGWQVIEHGAVEQPTAAKAAGAGA